MDEHPGKPTRAILEGDEIVIRILFKDIPVLLRAAEDFAEIPHMEITDIEEYAQDVVRALNEEEPNDGTSLIDSMIDTALREAIEQGSTAVKSV